MKRIFFFCLLLQSLVIEAQYAVGSLKPTFITAYPLPITHTKTTNLIFPAPIVSVDRGSGEVLAQKAVGVEHILQVKAAGAGFAETNLTVILAGGGLYSFDVTYAVRPGQTNFSFAPKDKPIVKRMKDVPSAAASILNRPFRCLLVKSKNAMLLQVGHLLIADDVLYVPLRLTNFSRLSYEVGSLRFFIRDGKVPRRTAVQEAEREPLSVYHPLTQVGGQRQQTTLVAFQKFTMTKGQRLWVEVVEREGGRHLSVPLKKGHLVRVRTL